MNVELFKCGDLQQAVSFLISLSNCKILKKSQLIHRKKSNILSHDEVHMFALRKAKLMMMVLLGTHECSFVWSTFEQRHILARHELSRTLTTIYHSEEKNCNNWLLNSFEKRENQYYGKTWWWRMEMFNRSMFSQRKKNKFESHTF